MNNRKADMVGLKPSGGGKVRINFHAPSRGLIGYHGESLTDTRGTGVMNRLFHEYAPYALFNIEPRGPLFITSGTKVYQGMVIGEHSRGNDLEVNPIKGKQLTNFRASGKEEQVKLTTPRKMSLEEALAYIADDELVEVTPKNIRLRKRYLNPNERKRASRAREAVG